MVKTPDELALARASGKLLASVFEMLDGQNLAGMSTNSSRSILPRGRRAKGSTASNMS